MTITVSGDIDRNAKFFATGGVDKIVYTTATTAPALADRMGTAASVVGLGDDVDPADVLADLAARGVERLMIEGGGTIHTMFLSAGLVDELHVVFAPFFVGDAGAPRFVNPAAFPQDSRHRMILAEARTIGDCVLLRYLPQR